MVFSNRPRVFLFFHFKSTEFYLRFGFFKCCFADRIIVKIRLSIRDFLQSKKYVFLQRCDIIIVRMKAHSLFLFYLTLWRPIGYTLVALGAIFEGDGTIFTSGFLTAGGFFDVGDILIIAFISILVGDTMWYFVGKKYISRFPRFAKTVDTFAKPFDRHITDHPTRTLIVTKFMYGAHHAVLIRAGMHHLDFKKFIKGELLAIPIWICTVGGLGYFSERTLHPIRHYLKFAEISLLFGLLAFFALEYFLHRLSTRELKNDNVL